MQAVAVVAAAADGLRVSYRFRRHPTHNPASHPLQSFLDSKLAAGDLVVLSSEDGRYLACAAGIVLALQPSSVVVGPHAPGP